MAAGWGLAAAIAWLSLMPAPPRLDMAQGDKLGHFLGYGGLMLWFCLLYAGRATRIGYALLWTAMGIALEVAQGHLGYRNYDVFDMYANAIGVLIGWAVSFAVPTGVRHKLR